MFYEVQGAPLYCYTGDKAFDPAQPTVVLIHGVLCDHSVWVWQARYLANHGFNVLSIDLPGHERSGGRHPRAWNRRPMPLPRCSTPWAQKKRRSSATAGAR